ncbi:lipocalin family protein [Gloeobacter morelensis]|uniref:Lipocalin family protein n=1 Tax=Gloeobacter morelensis MG652769 TaxID=2781736 RepID=A0ABY3PPX5_9CYAN|nr:lipocalin family protein [Gloeobacter morelensis]UFP95598.1 lipocalin family protein [Gloeobacter morelensis MG652769]
MLRLTAAPLAAVLGLIVCGSVVWASDSQPIETVAEVDFNRYDGRWYELARTPNIFQIGCTCVTANYSVLSESSISVFNTCNRFRPQGNLVTIDGVAVVADPNAPGKLLITFEGSPVAEDYWIIDLVEDPNNSAGDYAFAAIGGPNRDFIFIISRKPALETYQDVLAYQGIVKRLQAQHFPVGALNSTPQPASCKYKF